MFPSPQTHSGSWAVLTMSEILPHVRYKLVAASSGADLHSKARVQKAFSIFRTSPHLSGLLPFAPAFLGPREK